MNDYRRPGLATLAEAMGLIDRVPAGNEVAPQTLAAIAPAAAPPAASMLEVSAAATLAPAAIVLAAAQRRASATAPEMMAAVPQPEAKSFDESVEAAWNADAGLQREFTSYAAYRAWRASDQSRKTGEKASAILASSPDIGVYVKRLEARGEQISPLERKAIEGYTATWSTSPEIRGEFGDFACFAAWMRAKDRGLVKSRSR